MPNLNYKDVATITVKFVTLGCKTNLYESEVMAEMFRRDGWEVIKSGSADVCIINTCTVTGTGAGKSRRMIHRIRREDPDCIVAVTGCFAQTEPHAAEDAGADIVIGTDGRAELPRLVREAAAGKSFGCMVGDISKVHTFEELGSTVEQSRIRANIKIEDGCRNFCTYCIIPYARGPVRSRKLQNIINEAKTLAEHGYEEIVLTGIHIGSYGLDLDEDIGLIDVVEALDDIEGIRRIRLGSVEPMTITDEFVSRATRLRHLCPHFHLSLQSGCTETLRRMRRRYTADEFAAAAERLRDNISDAALTTDLMVGFVGETDEEFERSYEFCEKIGFMQMHVFKYSVRRGTAAEHMDGGVAENIKDERSRRMIALSDRMKEEFYKKYIGKPLDVLLEQKRADGYCHATTPNYMDVLIEAPDGYEGRMLPVRGTEYSGGFLYAEPVRGGEVLS